MKAIKQSLLAAALSIPTSELSSWKQESYSKIPANKVSIVERQLKVSVQKSASPLFYVFKSKTVVTGFKVEGQFKGLPQFTEGSRQGQKAMMIFRCE